MKKYIIAIIGLVIFLIAFFITNSWKISLIVLGVIGIYLFIEFGLEIINFRDSVEQAEENFEKEKKRFNKNSENNPTIR